MTEDQLVVSEALARGRLIVPFQAEISSLRKLAANGELTASEQERLGELEKAFKTIQNKDQWFHSVMQAGDYESAEKIAADVLKIAEAVE